MEKESKFYIALKWITGVLDRMDISYQIAGGLAARCYGSTRTLHDIDIYVPGSAFPKLVKRLNEYVEFGPVHHKDENWDLVFLKLDFDGQQIEFGDADNTRYYDSQSRRWIKQEINFSESNSMMFEGLALAVMPKQKLITYKQRLGRTVDQIDIREMKNETNSY